MQGSSLQYVFVITIGKNILSLLAIGIGAIEIGG